MALTLVSRTVPSPVRPEGGCERTQPSGAETLLECKPASWRGWSGPKAPEWPANRPLLPADGWRTSGAASAVAPRPPALRAGSRRAGAGARPTWTGAGPTWTGTTRGVRLRWPGPAGRG